MVSSGKTNQGPIHRSHQHKSIIHLHRNNKILATLFTPPTMEDITVLALAALTANILMMELGAAYNKKQKRRKNDGQKRCQRRRSKTSEIF
jgi:hypothetical protein